MRHYRRRIGTRLQAHQFNIRSIGKTRRRHLGRMIRVRPAILGRNTHRRAEGLPHLIESRARHRHMIDTQFRRSPEANGRIVNNARGSQCIL